MVGTLSISYHTNADKELLRDVRLWITGPDGDKRPAYDWGAQTHTDAFGKVGVIIDTLPPGQYQIDFDTSRTDGILEPVSTQTVSVSVNQMSRVTQFLPIQLGSLEASIRLPRHNHQVQSDYPAITLKDRNQRVVKTATGGYLYAQNLSIGHYTLNFEPMEDFETPDPIRVHIKPNETAGPTK